MTHRQHIDVYHAALRLLAKMAHDAGVPCPGDGEKFDPEGDCKEMINQGKCPECFAGDALQRAKTLVLEVPS
jgi:hypothetical protein